MACVKVNLTSKLGKQLSKILKALDTIQKINEDIFYIDSQKYSYKK